MLQSQHPRFSRMASNVALLCSTLVWSSRSMEYLHIDPIYATDWSLPVLPWNRNGTTLLRMGKPLVKQTGMNEMPQADGKTALGIPWPQNACSIETNENYLSKVLQYTVKSWHRHEPHENLNRMWPTVAGTDFKPFARPSFSDICVDAAQILSFSWDAGRAKCSAVRKWPQNLAWKVDELNIKQ